MWVKIDDGFYDHPKFVKAGPLGIAMWATALAWCNRNIEANERQGHPAGFVPESVVRRLIDWQGVAWRCWSGELVGGGEDAEAIAVADWLVKCGIFEATEGGYLIHDYDEYQQPEKVKDIRAKRAEAGRRGAEARWSAKSASAKASSMPSAIANGKASAMPSDEANQYPGSRIPGPYEKPPVVPLAQPASTNGSGSQGEPATATKRRTRLPEGFTLEARQREDASKRGMPEDVMAAEFQRFRDHHTAKGSVMADWPAAWRTWVSNWRSFQRAPVAVAVNGNGHAAPRERKCDICRSSVAEVKAMGECPVGDAMRAQGRTCEVYGRLS